MKTLIVVLVVLVSLGVAYAEDIQLTQIEALKSACGFIAKLNTITNTTFQYCSDLQVISGKNPSTFSYAEINKYAFTNSLDLENTADYKQASIINGVIDTCVKASNQLNVLRSDLPVCK
jgi:hypothetical protein